ncbi:S28 family serine protease [Legionella worsleiensis]|uniref:Serine carboxypeptidase n=1 Tax=Legionella worsleiensis TaxID=45076 RepID=A0A0W1AEB3_9GAMM|nr:S28 family serine protease [Legionella worsleiensis]KTD79669.1 serine carboxypeptidase [Legionella worsleiensis]STY32179.1 serine carboxypeptidase [Legionella worsleiensis]
MNYFKQGLITLVGLLSCLSTAFAGPVALFLHKHLEDKQPQLIDQSIKTLKFTQRMDHNHPESGTFTQRFYLDETFGPKANDPVFFYICGESECTKRSLNGAIRTYAKKHHAKLVALEHRYYGESLPLNSYSTQDLRFLSTEIALDDLAYFQRQISKMRNWNGTWIAFGGSYPGSLSAYYRLKFPYLVAGSLASSAPVMAKEDFYEYDAHVTQVAGPECAQLMRSVVHKAEEALGDANKLQEIKDLFVATEVEDPVDFLYLIADTGAAAIQYGMRNELCKALSTSKTPLIGYSDFAKKLYKTMGVSAVEMTAQGAVSENPADYKNGIGMRQWYYQSCTEYGYWQNAHSDESLSTRSSLINLDYHRSICQRLFGLSKPANTSELNKSFYFPLQNDLVSNIYFTNGDNDPWSVLSLSELNGNAENLKLTYYLIEGAAHCEDLHSPSASDSESLTHARTLMNSLIEQWLKKKATRT